MTGTPPALTEEEEDDRRSHSRRSYRRSVLVLESNMVAAMIAWVGLIILGLFLAFMISSLGN